MLQLYAELHMKCLILLPLLGCARKSNVVNCRCAKITCTRKDAQYLDSCKNVTFATLPIFFVPFGKFCNIFVPLDKPQHINRLL